VNCSARSLFNPLFACLILAILAGCSKEKLPSLVASRQDSSRSIVFGSLFNLDQGEFVSGAVIQANPGFIQVESDTEGNFFFDSLGRGQFQLIAREGQYSASIEVDTISTDVVSVDLTFGTTSRGAEDFSFREGSNFLSKKLLNNQAPEFYEGILQNAPRSFLEIESMDWNPRVPEEILFSAKEPLLPFKIYKYQLSTQILEVLVEDAILDTTDPTYSPDGKRFAFLQDGEISIAFVDSADTTRSKLIRDKALILKDSTGRTVLKIDQRNEQNSAPTTLPIVPGFSESGGALGLRDPATGAPLPFTDPLTGLPINDPLTGLPAKIPVVFAEAAFYRNQLNEYFNFVCVNSTPAFPCINQFLHFFDQGVFDDNVAFNSNAGVSFGYSSPNYSNTGFFDALNSPAECEMIFSAPRWSGSGQQVAFLARPSGCTTARPTVCKRSCDESSNELFVAPVDVNRDNLLGRNLVLSQADFERLDKLTVIQVTNDVFEDLNPSWDPQSGVLLYEKAKVLSTGDKRFFLYSSNPTPGGFLTRLLLRNGEVEHHAQVSPDGKRILWVSKEFHEQNPRTFSQVFLGNWTGVIRDDQLVTFYSRESSLAQPRFYKLLPSAFGPEILN
jgi:hypothetical protein